MTDRSFFEIVLVINNDLRSWCMGQIFAELSWQDGRVGYEVWSDNAFMTVDSDDAIKVTDLNWMARRVTEEYQHYSNNETQEAWDRFCVTVRLLA